MIVYGCLVTSESRYRRWAGLGFARVMHPEDMTALASETGLAEACAEIVAAMRERPECEAVVIVEQDVEIVEPRFAERVMRRLREPGTEVLTAGDGAILVLSPWALGHVRFDARAGASAAELAASAAAQVREHGREAREEEIAFGRPSASPAGRPPPATAGGVRSCKICGEPLPLTGEGRAIVTCRSCGVGATVPEPTRDIESDGIWEEQYGGNRLLSREQWFKEGRLRLDWIGGHRAGGTLVDVGCGTGELVAVAAERGFHALGIEPSPLGADEARTLPGVAGVLSGIGDWASAFPGRRADVMTLFHVLEHVHEPREFLAEMLTILAGDGLLFIEVPHFGSTAARRNPVAWTGTAMDDHVLHYTAGSLERLLRDTGYRVLQTTPMPTMIYDEPGYWTRRCQNWLAEGYVAPPEDLLRVLAAPAAG